MNLEDNKQFNSTEEDILATINDEPPTRVNDDAPEGGEGAQPGQSAEGDEDEGQEPAKQPAGGKEQPKEGKDGKEKGDKDGAGKPAGKQPQKPADGQLDPNQANAFRRMQYDNQRLKREFESTSNTLRETTEQLNTLQRAFGQINGHGLTPDELNEGGRLIALYKRDPLAAITEILTTSKENGIDLSRLNLQTIDTNAIRQLIQNEVGSRVDPLVQEREQARLNAEDKAAAMGELDDFLGLNPEAEAHLEAITKVMQALPGIGLENAWDKVQAWAYRNGVDLFSPPDAGTTAAPTGDQPPVRKPLPNGGGRQIAGNGSGTSAPAEPKKPAPARVGQSWDDIISEAMTESGIPYRR